MHGTSPGNKCSGVLECFWDQMTRHMLTPQNIVDGLPHWDFSNLKLAFGMNVLFAIYEPITSKILPSIIRAITLDLKRVPRHYLFVFFEIGMAVHRRVIVELPC